MKKNLEVNALMDFDKIKIVATINVKDNLICIHDESINSNCNRKEVIKQIKNAINSIEAKTLIKVEMINIIFNDFMKNSELLGFNTKILEETIHFENERFLSVEDSKKIVSAMIKKSKNRESGKELISVVPFKFKYIESGSSVDKYSQSFPIEKKLKKLQIDFSVRFMDKNKYRKSIEYFEALNLKVNNVTLESQLSIYGNKEQDLNTMDFVLSIQNNKTVLISSINDVVIKTDELELSFDKLLRKISSKFGISIQEAKNLIDCYAKLNSITNNNEIIYSSNTSNNNDLTRSISKNDIIDITKSFLRSICQQANEIINKRVGKKSLNNEIKIVGEFSKMNEISNYCSKYFEKVKMSLHKELKSIYKWNKSNVIANGYWTYIKMLDNKLNPKTFYYNNNNERFNGNKNYNSNKLFEAKNNEIVEALLA